MTSIGEWAFEDSGITKITIPDSVTELGENPFCGCSDLLTVSLSSDHPALEVIDNVLFSKSEKRLIWCPENKEGEYEVPQGIETIDKFAFSDCHGLTNITIPDSVSAIGKAAFIWCTNLMEITIPNSVTSIGDMAFSSCDNITLIVERDSYAVQYCKDNNLNYTYPDANDWLNE